MTDENSRKQSNEALEIYRSGEWNSISARVDEKDEATVDILDKSGKHWTFKVKNHSKGEKEWKIVEDADA